MFNIYIYVYGVCVCFFSIIVALFQVKFMNFEIQFFYLYFAYFICQRPSFFIYILPTSKFLTTVEVLSKFVVGSNLFYNHKLCYLSYKHYS